MKYGCEYENYNKVREKPFFYKAFCVVYKPMRTKIVQKVVDKVY